MDNFKKAKIAFDEASNGIKVKENEKIVLESKTGWCYNFAKDIPEADIKAHEQVILELKDSYYSYNFALNIPGADIKAHEKVILELKSPYYCYLFAREISSANIEEYFKIIVNSKDKYWFNYFIEHVNYKGTKVEEWLLYI